MLFLDILSIRQKKGKKMLKKEVFVQKEKILEQWIRINDLDSVSRKSIHSRRMFPVTQWCVIREVDYVKLLVLTVF